MKFHWHRRHLGEIVAKTLMYFSLGLVFTSLALILWTVLSKGLPALTWDMVSQTPKGGFYLDRKSVV